MSKFSENKIFEDSQICAILDMIYHNIEASIENVGINTKMALSGKAAVDLQDSTTGAVDNVIFVTNDDDVYTYIQQALPAKVGCTGAILFRERTILYFENFVVEIWKVDGAIGITLAKDIYVQDKSKINPILL